MSLPARPVPEPVLANQHSIVRGLLAALRPHWRRDRALPARIESLLRGDRRFGSRDRRLYRELTYTALRILPWIESLSDDEALGLIAHFATDLPATAAFRARYATTPPRTLNPDDLLPDWLRDECPEAFQPPHRDAVLARAPVWIRLQDDDRQAVLAALTTAGLPAPESSVLPDAWRYPPDTAVAATEPYESGRVEIQDLGSQLLLACAAPAPGEHWLDACAGAGGKTLQLARLVRPRGSVAAYDIRSRALEELRARATRARLDNVKIVREPEGTYDAVLVDAPCSGNGTWRRSPHLKWTTSPADLAAAAERQLSLLQRFSRQVAPGGRLVYATCSLCRTENDAVVARFLAANPGFMTTLPANTYGLHPCAHGLAVLPGTHDTDGFYVAVLARRGRDSSLA
jgi:16S rRNA (cytosine967-C5)-methyltransferase